MLYYFYEWLIKPYHDYQTYMIYLELLAASLGVAGVYFSYKRNILVYISGSISSLIYIYLLFHWELFGDMLLNVYYLLANIYGFMLWMKHFENGSKVYVYVGKANSHQIKYSLYIFILTIIITPIIYAFQKGVPVIQLPLYSFVDSFVTAISFSGLYLMIKRAIENWYLWAIADIISIPLFIYKGYGITAIQYLVFLVLVYLGWKAWLSDLRGH